MFVYECSKLGFSSDMSTSVRSLDNPPYDYDLFNQREVLDRNVLAINESWNCSKL